MYNELMNVINEILEEGITKYETGSYMNCAFKAYSKNFEIIGDKSVGIILIDKKNHKDYILPFGTMPYIYLHGKLEYGINVLADIGKRLKKSDYRVKIKYFPKTK